MPSRQGPRLRVQLSSFEHPKSQLQALINSHPVCSAVQLLHPSASSAPVDLEGLQPSGFLLCRTRLGDLVADVAPLQRRSPPAPDGGSPRKGLELTALALGPSMYTHGGAAITPDGALHLTLGRAMHERLGLPGRSNPAQPGKEAQ